MLCHATHSLLPVRLGKRAMGMRASEAHMLIPELVNLRCYSGYKPSLSYARVQVAGDKAHSLALQLVGADESALTDMRGVCYDKAAALEAAVSDKERAMQQGLAACDAEATARQGQAEGQAAIQVCTC